MFVVVGLRCVTIVRQFTNGRTSAKRARPSYKKRQTEPKCPWISGVYCQQIFTQGLGLRYFEVVREEGREVRGPIVDKWEEVQKITRERLAHIEKKTKATIEEVDENLEPSHC
jgi:hypothetical protein